MVVKQFIAVCMIMMVLSLSACADQAPATTSTPAPATATITQPTPAPTQQPTSSLDALTTPTSRVIALEWAGYAAYQVQDGDTLANISERGGSLPLLVQRYNRLEGEPSVGRAVIVPQLPNTTSTLKSSPIVINKGETRQPWIALTLDAGKYSTPTLQMLDTLKERNIQITFFVTGTWIKENPDLIKRMVADGHEIGNHSLTHPDFTTISDQQIVSELEQTEQAFTDLLGMEYSIRPFFRPPYGALDDRVTATVIANGYLPIMWTFDSLDSVGEPKSADFLLQRITTHLPADQLRGAIILAHVGNQTTADALPAILDTFAAQGFEVRRLSDVLNP